MNLSEDFKKKYQAGERNFSGQDLEGINLSGMELTDVSLKDTLIQEAEFSKTKLKNADLSLALATDGNWEEAKFENVDMYEANFGSSNLRAAQFINCNIKEVRLDESNLENSLFKNCTFLDPDFSEANLSNSVFTGEVLNGYIPFDKAILTEANFKSCKFENSEFREVVAINTIFENIETQRILIEDADLSGASFKGSILKELYLEACNIETTDFTGASFIDADLSGQSLDNVNLQGVRYNEATIFPDDFDPQENGMILINALGEEIKPTKVTSKTPGSSNRKPKKFQPKRSLAEIVENYEKGVRDFSGWVIGKGGTIQDIVFENAKFNNMDFKYVKEGHHFKNVTFKNCDFSNAEIYINADQVVFDSVIMEGTVFGGSTLNGAKFTKCKIKDGGFKFGQLNESEWKDSIIENTDFNNAKLEKARIQNCSFISHNNMDFYTASFADSIITNSLFKIDEIWRLAFTRATLTGCQFLNTIFSECYLYDGQYSGTNFANCIFEETGMERSDFSKTNLKGAKFNKCKLKGAVFTEAIYNNETSFPSSIKPSAWKMIKEGEEIAQPKEMAKAVSTNSKKTVKKIIYKDLTRDKFFEIFGKPEKLPVNSYLQSCRMVPEGPFEKWEDLPLMFTGELYNIGYFKAGQNPDKIELDWTAVANDLTLAKEIAAELEGLYESSSMDCPYIPLVIAPSAEEQENWQDISLIVALGLRDDLTEADWDGEEIQGQKNLFVTEEEEEEYDEFDRDEEKLEKFTKASKLMNKSLCDMTRYSIYNFDFENPYYREYPIIWAGRSKSGNFVGILTVRSES